MYSSPEILARPVINLLVKFVNHLLDILAIKKYFLNLKFISRTLIIYNLQCECLNVSKNVTNKFISNICRVHIQKQHSYSFRSPFPILLVIHDNSGDSSIHIFHPNRTRSAEYLTTDKTKMRLLLNSLATFTNSLSVM